MGEKGIAADLTDVVGASPSIIERTTTTVTSTVSNTAGDVLDKIRDQGIAATADAVVDEARERAKRDKGDEGAPPA